MRGKKLGRLVGVLLAAAVAVGVTGQAALAAPAKTPPNVPGFNGSTIKLGAITPQSGLASVVGKPLTEGNRVYWDAKNAKGGVGGKYKVDLDIEDSQYQVETALQAYDKIKGDVVAFNQILGTQIVKSILPRLKQEQLTGAPATLDSLWVKEKNLIPIGAPYQVEVANGVAMPPPPPGPDAFAVEMPVEHPMEPMAPVMPDALHAEPSRPSFSIFSKG